MVSKSQLNPSSCSVNLNIFAEYGHTVLKTLEGNSEMGQVHAWRVLPKLACSEQIWWLAVLLQATYDSLVITGGYWHLYTRGYMRHNLISGRLCRSTGSEKVPWLGNWDFIMGHSMSCVS